MLLEIPETVIQQDICFFLDIRAICALKITCSALHQQLNWDKAEFVCPLANTPGVLPFLNSKLRNHVKTENTEAVVKIISLPIENLVNAYDKYDVTPLMQACSCSSGDMLSLLLAHGASLQLPHRNKSNIVHHLFQNGMSADTLPEKLQRLVEGQDKATIEQIINQQDTFGCTPLHHFLFRVLAKHPQPEYPLDIQTTLNIITILRQFSFNPHICNEYHNKCFAMLHSDVSSTCSGLRCTREEYGRIYHALTD